MFNWSLWLCITALVVALPAWSSGQDLGNGSIGEAIHSIQINSFFDRVAAENRCAVIRHLGSINPFIIEDPPLQRVLWGCFDVHLDALVASRWVEESIAGSRPCVLTISPEEALSASPTEAVPVTFFGVAAEWRQIQACGWIPPTHDVPVSGEVTMTPVHEGVLRVQGPHWISTFEVECRNPERAEALESLLSIAAGGGEATPLRERLQACWDSVQALRAANRHVDAYAGLCEMESLYARGSEPWALCAAERVRLALEIAVGRIPWQMPELPGSGTHRYADVRAAARSVLDGMTGESETIRVARASVELAIVESHFYEQDFDQALRLGVEFLNRYSGDSTFRREVALANLRMGKLAEIQHSIEAARAFFVAALDMNLAPRENYEGIDCVSHAAAHLAMIAARESDWQTMEIYVRRMEMACPWHVATHCLRYQVDQQLPRD